jgi:phosphohistidine phosphatase
MDLLVVRHAIAFERDRQRWPDDAKRPLSPEGMRRARQAAAGIKRITKAPDLVLTSPLVRARQTADILTQRAAWPKAVLCPELAPEASPRAAIKLLQSRKENLVAVIGHEPHLSRFVSACLLGEGNSFAIEIRKNGVVLLTFEDTPRAGSATLKWFAMPRMLRAMRSK